MAYLEIRDLRKEFGSVVALDGVSADINQKEVVCLLGPSGNGKTTFLRAISNLTPADSGSIVLDGETIFPTKKNKMPDNIGMVFQSFNLFPQYNSVQNITLAMNLKKMNTKEKNEEIAFRLLSEFGLADKAKSYPYELSGGQKQRLAIARALALNPNVLLFDEPTSALDPKTTRVVGEIIKELKEKMTIIIVTHDIEFAKSVAGRVYFILDGKIELFGKNEEVFSSTEEKWLTFLGNSEEEE